MSEVGYSWCGLEMGEPKGAAMAETVVKLEGVSRQHGGEMTLDGVEMEVKRGAVYALTGLNGAGKTTLLRVMLGLKRASTGRCEVLGMNARRLRGGAWERVGVVIEEQPLAPGRTVEESLGALRRLYVGWDERLEQELLERLGLRTDTLLRRLSRGEAKKLRVVGALAFRPELVVMEDWLGGMDAASREELKTILEERREETTVIVTTEECGELEGFATEIGYLERGRMRFSEPVGELMERFREVEVTLAGGEELPRVLAGMGVPRRPVRDGLMASWLEVTELGGVIRLVESRFDGVRTRQDMEARFPESERLSARRMSLKEIVAALERHGRSESAGNEKSEAAR
uniref:Putative ABC-type Fe(3+) transport system,ATPase component n=1 Tax=mine drainage metagenome TaxID=410659 RepID=E6QPG6_9ZZZZ